MADQIIAREDARAQGLRRFFTGVSCRQGHVAERETREGKCVACIAKRAAVSSKRWALQNPDKMKAKTARWRAANPEKLRESNRRSKQARQKIYNERQRLDYALNPEKYRTVERKRRAQMRGLDGSHNAADVRDILAAQKTRCAYCRTDLRKAKWHVDHIVPLARGGSNGRANIQIACAPCNQSKNARDPIAFAQSIGRLL